MKNITAILSLLVIIYGFTVINRLDKREKVVLFNTKYGDIKVKLYNETPVHRDNFIKLVKEGFYDSLLFHRVIPEFMIQGGDPDSKNAKKGKRLGEGDVGYKLTPEIHDHLFHKRGALAAAREGDHVNPKRESSGCQFYIVQGKVHTQEELKKLEERLVSANKNKFVFDYISDSTNVSLKDSISFYKKAGDQENMVRFIKIAEEAIQPKLDDLKFSPEKVQAYTTVGGSPHLDRLYTVFGEVIEGMDVIDSIAIQITDKRNRPVDDIIFTAKVVRR